MTRGRLEARITVPEGGYAFSVGGGSNAVPAGNYYIGELLDAVADDGGITAVVSRGESGTGRVTLSDSGTFSITWIDLELRDLLGFTANLSGAASYLAPGAARALWIATCPYNAPNEVGLWGGWPEADFRSVESAAGVVTALAGHKKEISSLTWEAITRSRASRAHEVFVGESFQRFIEDGVWGFAAWGTPGGPIRFYPSAEGVDWVSYYVTDLKSFKPDEFASGWAGGPWTVKLPRLVFAASSFIAGGGGPGEPPPAGDVCAQIFTGSGPPPGGLVWNVGDFYLDVDTGDLYQNL
ncbi:MAG TPA: hypothetical protein VK607_10750 [Kofleriaceae bacterium]|nr:hypothetical protein [Kofleriaceae bacterium]